LQGSVLAGCIFCLAQLICLISVVFSSGEFSYFGDEVTMSRVFLNVRR